jgi:hypothetical protein
LQKKLEINQYIILFSGDIYQPQVTKLLFLTTKVFIDRNSDYPRMDKLRSLAEHKLSTSQISPKKIINWFDQNGPISGYGKMILGESYILTGNKSQRNKSNKRRMDHSKIIQE